MLNLAIEEQSSINTKPKSQDVVVVKENFSSIELEEVKVSKDTFDFDSSYSYSNSNFDDIFVDKIIDDLSNETKNPLHVETSTATMSKEVAMKKLHLGCQQGNLFF